MDSNVIIMALMGVKTVSIMEVIGLDMGQRPPTSRLDNIPRKYLRLEED